MCKECGCGLRTALICPACGGMMVLINGRPICMSCGASPSLGGDPPEEEEHHEDPEHQGEAEAEAVADLAKLRLLLTHWIEHNQEHAASLQQWAVRALKLEKQATASQIEVAVEQMETCNKALAAALKALEE